MKKEYKQMQFNFLVGPSKEGGFWGMCWETGAIQQAETRDQLVKNMIDATSNLIDIVIKDPKQAGVLNAGLPLRYRIAFFSYLFQTLSKFFVKRVLYTSLWTQEFRTPAYF